MLRVLTIALLSMTSPAVAIGICGSGQRVSCVVDGDTFWWQGEKYRTFGYDTPEPVSKYRCGGSAEGALASKATNRFLQLWNTTKITIRPIGDKDRYGRILAVVMSDGTNVGDILISEGLARRYPDGREFWCH